METIEKNYSDNWKHLGSVIIYQRPEFQFHSEVIITELDDCLIKHITQAKLYNTMNPTNVEIFANDLIDLFQKECIDKSIIVISNQVNQNKLNLDIIKRKIESIAEDLHIPILCMFALKPNCFMKPHTGSWRLLNAYYKKYGGSIIHKATVVSNEGGLIVETNNKNGQILKKVISSDVDRAFAWNINVPFKSIDEYLGWENQCPFKWDNKIISPEIRDLYLQQVKKMSRPNIFHELANLGECDYHVIMVMGAPRSGKTRLSKYIVDKWRASPFGDHNAIERLGTDEYTFSRRINTFKKLVDNRISVIIDGKCHTNQLRLPFIEYMKGRNIPILFIEVNCGLEMAKVFNHACVEESNTEKTMLYKTRLYNIYKAECERPKTNKHLKYILYTPDIEDRQVIMRYRY